MGFAVRPRDTADLVKKLEKLLANSELTAALGAYNADYAREHFSPQLVTQKLE
ncbi:MAG: hypothetical protein OEQ53_00210 [Saprospiraceae bacterium]|nr:hypothetical protein [Saprospiraceae bacterium]